MTHLSPSDFSLVFQQVSRLGGTRAASVAQTVGLKPTELREALSHLATQGLLAQNGSSFRLNPSYGRVVGVDMGASHLHFALSDYNGKILRESDQKIPPEEGPRRITERIKAEIGSIISSRKATTKSSDSGMKTRLAGARSNCNQTLRAIAIGVPSPVDANRGEVSFANNLPGWRKIPLRRELENEFRVPVFVENDANMAAIGEHWRGAARGAQTFVFIALGTGVGSGIFVEGRLMRGRSGAAGEVHLMNLDWQRWNEDFGDVGYFETHVSGMGIASEGRRVLSSVSSNGGRGLAGERDAMFVFDAMREGDSRARQLLERIFTMLGVGVANLVAVLDPELIVFGGGIVLGAPELLVSTVQKVVKRIQKHPPRIRTSELEGRAQIYGAIYSALRIEAEKRLKSPARPAAGLGLAAD